MKSENSNKNTMKNKFQSCKAMILIAGLVVVLFSVFGTVYYFVTEQIVQSNIESMRELERHDSKAIENSIQFRKNQLRNLADSLWRHRILSIQALHEQLNTTNIQFGMRRISLRSQSGDYYSSQSQHQSVTEFDLLISENPQGFVKRLDSLGGRHFAKGLIVFGMPIDTVRVENQKFDYLVGEIYSTSLSKELRFENYNGEGSSAVIDRRGNFIVVNEKSQTNNFYEFLSERAIIRGFADVNALKKAIASGQDVTTTVTDRGRTYIMVTSRMNNDWTIISYTPKQVFEALSNRIISVFIALMGVVLMLVIFSVILFNRNRTRQAKQALVMQHNAEMEKALRLAEKANISKSIFLNNMSHDIRTPMNAVLGFANLMEKHMDDRAKLLDYISKIKMSGQHLLDLINSVLELSRIESGKIQLEEVPTSLNSLLTTSADMFTESMKEKALAFETHFDLRHDYLYLDGTRLCECLINFLSNSLKYTPQGGSVRFEARELDSEDKDRAVLEFRVKDTGIGMSKEFLPTIFETFTREKSATESQVIGFGLGMPITRKLVEMMGGVLEVQSELGHGTEFVMRLTPRIAPEPENVDEAADSDVSLLNGKRILLAEDNALNAEIAIEVLTEFGLIVDHAEDGVVCVDKMEKAPSDYYDLILMDIQMPNMNGYKATQTIRQLQDPVKNQIPIFAMTANAFAEDRQQAIEAGMNGHLSKPIDVNEIIRTITAAIKLTRSKGE